MNGTQERPGQHPQRARHQGQRRGVKMYAGQSRAPATSSCASAARRVHPGPNVGIGRDYTLFALIDGTVLYERLGKDRRRARIVPSAAAQS